MADIMQRTAPRKNRSIMIAVAVAAVIALAAGWHFLARPHITQELAERRVKEIVDNFNTSAHAEGSALTLLYDGVKVEKEKGRDVVIVVNPRFQAGEGGNTYGTANLYVVPKNIDFGAMVIEARDPLVAKVPNERTTVVEHAEPFAVDLTTEKSGNQQIIHYDAKLPAALDVKNYPGEVTPDGSSDHTRITMDNGAVFKGKLDETGEGKETKLAVRNLKSVDAKANTELMSIAEINVDLQQNKLAENKMQGAYTVSIRGINAADDLQQYGPFNIVLDAKMSGLMPPAMPLPEGQTPPPSEMDVTLNALEFSGKDASLKGKGQMKSVASETVPVGSAEFTLAGLPFIVQEAASHGALTDGQRALINDIVKKISGGKDVSQSDPLIFIVKRDAGNSLKIGEATFDDILALYLTHSMGQGMMPGMPGMGAPLNATPEMAPQSTPIPEGAVPPPESE